MRASGRARRGAIALVAGAAVVAATVALVRWSARPPAGPVPVPWDRATCAECRMLVSEPAFAAQLHLADGTVLFFDDPGCLLRHEAERSLDVHARWFHHHREPRWVSGDAVAFVETSPTPMGYGLGAVTAQEAAGGLLSLDRARARVRVRDSARGEAPR